MMMWKVSSLRTRASRRTPWARRRAVASVEVLEQRIALHADGSLSGSDRFSSISFAADGVAIGDESNSLNATLAEAFPQQNWQETILRAFQTWASETNTDIGLVDEEGMHAFGVPGPRSGDDRFGDIRIGARPLADNTMALSVSQNSLVSGSWAADVVFNSEAHFDSLDDLYSVALHEAGHVFGLEHSADPASAMHIHGVSASTQLTPTDISLIRQLHGELLPDAWEGVGGNDDLESATGVEPIEIIEEQPASGPVVAFGNLHDVNDVDFFSFETNDKLSGRVTITLHTAGTSLLRPSLTVMESDGTPLVMLAATGMSGKSLEYTIPSVAIDEEYFVRVESAVDDVFAIGGYALAIEFEDKLSIDAQQVDDLAKSRLRLSQDEIESLLVGDDDFLHPDNSSNDSEDDAAEIEPSSEFGTTCRYTVNGSIETATDVDVYSISSPDASQNLPVMIVALHTVNSGTLIPRVEVVDENRDPVAATTLVNGGGELVIQVDEIDADKNYWIRVKAAQPDLFDVGNYQLTVSFTDQPATLNTFASGAVGGAIEQTGHRLYVATPQLFHFVLQVDATETDGRAGVMLRVLSETGDTQQQFSSLAGESRSKGSVLLTPGTYALQLLPLFERATDIATSLTYEVRGDVISDPFAVDPTLPSDVEFECPDLPGVYCYPGGIESEDPFIWFDFLDQLPVIPDLNGTELQSALLGEWWSWYWLLEGNNVPPLSLSDEYTVNANQSLVVDEAGGVLANDEDPDSADVSVSLIQDVTHGTLSLNFDGSFTYEPDINFVGQDEFVYEAYDFRDPSTPTTVTITVQSVTLGDFTLDGVVDHLDLNELAAALQQGSNLQFDLNEDDVLDGNDWSFMVNNVLGTSFGDANLDGIFNSDDVILVLAAGQYEDGVSGNSEWLSGDWNGDGDFDTNDLIDALQTGAYVTA